MKRYLLYILAAGFLLQSCGDKKPAGEKTETGKPAEVKTTTPSSAAVSGDDNEREAYYKKMYARARMLKDPYTQVQALNGILLEDSAGNPDLTDSLALSYARINLLQAAEIMADQSLARNPDNQKMQELKLTVSAGQGKVNESVTMIRKMYERTKELKYLFTLAGIQVQQNKIKDAQATLREIERSPKFATEKIEVTSMDGRMEKVNAKAAVAYVRASIAQVQNNAAEFEKQLKAATEADPNFNEAWRMLDAFNQSRKQGGQ